MISDWFAPVCAGSGSAAGDKLALLRDLAVERAALDDKVMEQERELMGRRNDEAGSSGGCL